jgi:hypothetical protein
MEQILSQRKLDTLSLLIVHGQHGDVLVFPLRLYSGYQQRRITERAFLDFGRILLGEFRLLYRLLVLERQHFLLGILLGGGRDLHICGDEPRQRLPQDTGKPPCQP